MNNIKVIHISNIDFRKKNPEVRIQLQTLGCHFKETFNLNSTKQINLSNEH